jgi:stearoyl-CoA desaturase (Delta-9 desaturase)
MHLLPFAAIYTGVHWSAWIIMPWCFTTPACSSLPAGITGTFPTAPTDGPRDAVFDGAGGHHAMQKGPLWWAAHHRHHHKHSDQPEDVHSPKRGFLVEPHALDSWREV